ncbi:pepsin-like aspartic protease [Legionella adelaidensis]|nr:pepsin-like aspartic protease [Legionella adelaidensis]
MKIIISNILLLFSFNVFSFNIPLIYNEDNGDYAFQILFAHSGQQLKLMLDTGSSNLNVVGDEKICTNCNLLIEGKRYTPEDPVKPLNKEFDIRYGLGDGKLRTYQGARLKLNDLTLDNFTFGVYEQGSNINHIAGFAYSTIAEPQDNPLPTLFSELDKKYNLQNQFSLLFCDTRAPSYLFLGPLSPTLQKALQAVPSHKTPIVDKKFYGIKLKEVSETEGNSILKVPAGKDFAIVDSGTSAKNVFPDDLLLPLVKYIKEHTSKQNRDLPDIFWEGRDCVVSELVDTNSFPTLYFHFTDAHGKPFKLKLPPERYITSSACGEGYLKFAFLGYTINKTHKKTLNHKANLPEMIVLGTPFLEQYFTTFNRENPAELTFYDSEKLCNTANQQKFIAEMAKNMGKSEEKSGNPAISTVNSGNNTGN